MQLISVGQLIDQTWDHYRANWRELLSVSAWVLVPTIIAMVTMAMYPNATTMLAANDFSAMETGAVVVWFLNNTLLAPIVGLWVFLMIVKLIHSQMERRSFNFLSLAKNGWKLFLPVLLVNILIFLILAALWLTVVPGVFFYIIGALTNISFFDGLGAVLLAAGIIAAFVLMVEWLVYFIYAPMSLVIENIHGRKALDRSKNLIHGRFWSVLVRFIVPKLVFILILIAAEWLIGVVIGLTAASVSGFNTDLAAKLSTISITFSVALGMVFINPLYIISDYLLFNNLRATEKN
ncbi:MAG: hypothetical protein WC702_04295 [Patescibacteria group bacterium]|jgi:hypothetical protein